MRLADFDYHLPKQLIAQEPASPRDHARLLIYDRKQREISHDRFYNLEKYLLPKTTLVLNESKVEKARLRFGGVEIFIIETIDSLTIKALVRPGKKFMPGKLMTLPLDKQTLVAETLSVDEDGLRTLRLNLPVDGRDLAAYRLTPFPPYIRQDEKLSARYQTVYAKSEGSKAAPTAGLHFTKNLLANLSKNHPIAKLSLHVGMGTFAPVKTRRIEDHTMHSEDFSIPAGCAHCLNQATSITAVGTTTLRVLESVTKPFKATTSSTDIFIKPGYRFKAVDSLITNFHLPKTSLLMLVSAFMGSVDEMQRVYAHAIDEDYRFYSFGDVMLII